MEEGVWRYSQAFIEDAAGQNVRAALAGLQDERRLQQEQGVHLRRAGSTPRLQSARREGELGFVQ